MATNKRPLKGHKPPPPARIHSGNKRGHLFIKEWMEHLDISDEQMAGRLNVAKSTVYKRYDEQHRLTPGKIQQIADALGIGRSSLNYPPPIQSVDDELDKMDADEKQRAMVIDFVKMLANSTR